MVRRGSCNFASAELDELSDADIDGQISLTLAPLSLVPRVRS